MEVGGSLYYFPEECPSYDMDMLLYIEIDGMEKYFIPEKNTLILIEKKHKWTKVFDNFIIWKKN